ncbi:hypothetical protein ACIP5N_27625 [Streptomyces sp. NPDC088768]|uniref:hypothetical protein n=1 Tax=Streptomyces sp. NPDC088768 TaxID=3365894 RepID=UPI0037FA3BC9
MSAQRDSPHTITVTRQSDSPRTEFVVRDSDGEVTATVLLTPRELWELFTRVGRALDA